jgi:hypothetical protein
MVDVGLPVNDLISSGSSSTSSSTPNWVTFNAQLLRSAGKSGLLMPISLRYASPANPAQRRHVILPAEARHARRPQLGDPLHRPADGGRLTGGDGVERAVGNRFDEAEAEQSSRLAFR